MQIAERNALRMQVWEVDEQLENQNNLPEQYRNRDKIERLREMREQLEDRIRQMM